MTLFQKERLYSVERDVMTTMNDDIVKICKDAVVTNVKVFSSVRLDRLRKITTW
jgi:hypothetical protein